MSSQRSRLAARLPGERGKKRRKGPCRSGSGIQLQLLRLSPRDREYRKRPLAPACRRWPGAADDACCIGGWSHTHPHPDPPTVSSLPPPSLLMHPDPPDRKHAVGVYIHARAGYRMPRSRINHLPASLVILTDYAIHHSNRPTMRSVFIYFVVFIHI